MALKVCYNRPKIPTKLGFDKSQQLKEYALNDTIPVLNSVMSTADARSLNPLVLAFVGDSVQQLYVRTKLVESSSGKSGALHKLAVKEIKAVAQAEALERLLPLFTEEETAVYKRARNSKANTTAKNASVADYKKASGFEAVLGFLYLSGQHERLAFLLNVNNEETK
jgi:Uncharacterized protein conserved in bacteria